jgi:hypothetical protein
MVQLPLSVARLLPHVLYRTAVRQAGSIFQEYQSQIKTKVETFSG